jgi:hypothetical protein
VAARNRKRKLLRCAVRLQGDRAIEMITKHQATAEKKKKTGMCGIRGGNGCMEEEDAASRRREGMKEEKTEMQTRSPLQTSDLLHLHRLGADY